MKPYEVFAMLDPIKKDRTGVVISHIISQIVDSGIIYVLKEEHVVEIGATMHSTKGAEPIMRYSMHLPAA